MSSDRDQTRSVSLHNARLRYPTDDLSEALNDLQAGFGTFFDWPIDRSTIIDTHEFDRKHPDHPWASRHQERRQRASGFFWWLGVGDATLIDASTLEILHQSLFDVSAAVRYDIAMCLGHVNRPESRTHLERLLSAEPESDGVREAVRWALYGSTTTRFGSDMSNATPSGVVAPTDSDITRDRLHGGAMSQADSFCVLWAALVWERRHGFADGDRHGDLAALSAPDFTFGEPANPQRLATSQVRMFRRHLERCVNDRLAGSIHAVDVAQRYRSVLFGFKSIGYFPYYAGHEGSVRLRLLTLLDNARIQHDSDAELDGQIKMLAACYLAYTDYYLRGVPVELSSARVVDVRAFVSHSSLDKQAAREIADALEVEGIKIWLDERQMTVGDSIWDEVGRGIDTSDYLIILISPRSAASTWVRRELNAALAAEIDSDRKIVLPVLIERTELPTFLRERLYCDLTAGFPAGIEELIGAMALS